MFSITQAIYPLLYPRDHPLPRLLYPVTTLFLDDPLHCRPRMTLISPSLPPPSLPPDRRLSLTAGLDLQTVAAGAVEAVELVDCHHAGLIVQADDVRGQLGVQQVVLNLGAGTTGRRTGHAQRTCQPQVVIVGLQGVGQTWRQEAVTVSVRVKSQGHVQSQGQCQVQGQSQRVEEIWRP